ncbi:MAG: site-2 protease family protein [Rhodopirellula bahusiensis]
MGSNPREKAGVDDRMVNQNDAARDEPQVEVASELGQMSSAESPPAAPKVRLDPDLEFTVCEVAGVTIFRAAHSGTGQHFQFGAAEHYIASLLDGERSTTQIVEQAQRDGLDWSPEDVADFIAVLVSQKIAIAERGAGVAPVSPSPDVALDASSELLGETSDADESNLDDRLESATATHGKNDRIGILQSLKRMLSGWVAPFVKACSWLISLRFPLINANGPANALLPFTRQLFTPRGVVVAGAFIAISMTFALFQRRELTAELMRIFDSQLWIGMLGIWAVMKLIHEMGHAVSARWHGVQVGKAGIMFFLLAPLAYVDVTNAWRLPNRQSRASIAMAGVYVELLFASIAFWIWCWHPSELAAHWAAQIFFIAGPATLLVNANPLLRLDGYYVLSDWTDIPNLREQGRKLFGGWLQSKLFAMRGPSCKLSGWRRGFASCHAAASVVFQCVWMGGLIIVVSMWAGPVGLLMAMATILLWVMLPSIKFASKVWSYEESSDSFSKWSHRRRAIWTCVTFCFLAQFLVTLPSPLSRPVPVVVRFADDQILRSPIDGFVDQVAMQSGDSVMAGQVILELIDHELVAERDATQLELDAEEIKWQRHEGMGKLGLAEAAKQKSESLRRSLEELNAQVDSLRVVAKRDGEILTTDLDDLDETYVRAGEELVHVGVRQRMELLVSVGDSDLDAYRSTLQKNEPMQVLFRGGEIIEVHPEKLQPRASRQVPHPALAATVDGPLPVAPAKKQSQSSDPYELLTPRFLSIVPLTPAVSDRVRAGETGQMALRDQRSLGRRFWEWLSDDAT